MAPKVLVLVRTLVSTNPKAGVTSIMLTYLHWFKLVASSRVKWKEQAEVEAECRALYAKYKEELWMRPFDKNFVSFLFLLTPLFVLMALLRVSARLRLRLKGAEDMTVSTDNVARCIAMSLRSSLAF